MTLQEIIRSEYRIPAGTTYSRLQRSAFGDVSFGECASKSTDFVVPGSEVVRAIQVTSEYIARLQRAVDDMQACIDAGPVPTPTQEKESSNG
jgi:hypothetical protein